MILPAYEKPSWRHDLINRIRNISKNRIVNGILYVLVLITLLTMAALCMYFTLVAAASTPY
jgi:hypothetical protein